MPLPVATWPGKAIFARMARTCASLIGQGIDRWELVIGVSEQHKPVVAGWLKAFRLSTGIGRQQVRLVKCPTDTASNLIKLDRLIKSAQGDWVGFVFAGDRFAAHYVYECLMRIVQRPSVELVYFDDDVLNVRRGSSPADPYTRTAPQFKPDFSPDFLESHHYIGLSFAVKKSRLRQLVRAPWQQVVNFPMQLVLGLTSRIIKKNGFKPLLPAWHDDFPIQRIGQVLRHRDLSKRDGCRQSMHHETSKAALACARQLVADSLKSRHSGSHCPMVVLSKVSPGQKHGQKLGQKSNEKVNDEKINLGLLSHRLKVVWPLVHPLPKVSIIVPTKDQFAILKVCLSSLLDKTAYANYEVLVVDNQTTQSTALRYLSSLPARDVRVRVLKYDKPFNYSDINNQAVTQCDGEVLLFLNNDVEILDSDWLSEMVRHAIRAEVGCVGAKLLYPDRTIQHAGVSLGMHGVADHMYRGLEESTENDPYGYLQCVRNTGAVTGAVMAIRRSVFETVGGFDAKKLPVAFNDVDLCLKAEMAGYRTVWTPDACLIHHESKTRAPRKSKTIAKKTIKNATKSATKRTTTSNKKQAAHVQVQSHATERSEIAHMRASWGSLLKNKFRVLGQRHEPLRFL